MRIAYVHFYVEDAKTWCDWFVNYLGFHELNDEPLTHDLLGGVDTVSHTHTKVVRSGLVCFVLSSAISSISPVATYLRQHPPGVVDVAFEVENLSAIVTLAEQLGAKVILSTKCQENGNNIKVAKIIAWGGLTHTLLEKQFTINPLQNNSSTSGIQAIDHIVLNVPAGYLKAAIAWYQTIFDFKTQQEFNIHTEYSGLHSQVMVSSDGNITFPINEPATPNSQIQEFINVNQGAGIQHIALQTSDIIQNIAQLRNRGVSFLPISQTYYHQLQQRKDLPLKANELNSIAKQEILIDWQQDFPNAFLLQIFTQPIFSQPTFFFEFIERREFAQGFGEGNFRALFETMELEQVKRGTLELKS